MPNEFIARNGIIALNNSTITGSLNVSGNLTTPGTITAQTLIVQTVTSSVSTITGSTKFGTLPSTNTHQFSGSVSITGSLAYQNIPVGTTETNIVVTDASGNFRYRTNLSLQGTQGTQGTQGIQGTQGTQGIQGVQGTQGTQGTQGIQGVQGTQGTQGIQGVQGTQGTQGTQGIQGIQGTQGTQGTQGIQGTQGTQGIQGIQGSAANSITNNTDNYVVTATGNGATPFNGEANLTFNGSLLNVVGNITATGSLGVTGSLNVLGIVTMSASPSGDGNVLLVRNNNPSGNTNSVIALDTIASGGVGDIRLGSANPTGIRIYASEVGLTASPAGSGFQFFKNTHPTFPGTVFFDSGANNSAAIIFRTTVTSGTITERMRITAGGNVGIGTTNPTVKLQVNGTGGSFAGASDVLAGFKETGTNTNAYIAIDNSTAGYDSGIRLATNGTLQWTILNAKSVSPNALWFYDSLNSSARLVITQGGNVGIGTTNPTSLLHAVASSVNVAYFNRTTTDGDIMALAVGGTNAFVFNTSSGVRNIQAPGAVDLTMYTNSSERIRITSGGNVGIGTTSPSYKTSIVSTSASTINTVLTLWNADSSAGTGARLLLQTSGADNQYGAAIASVNEQASPSFQNAALVFQTMNNTFQFTNLTERMRITSTGNVGIGTTSPNEYSGYTFLTINNASTGTGLDLEVNGTRTATFNTTATLADLGSTTNIPLAFYTNGTEKMRITAGGNVLIGTTTDTAYKLNVVSDFPALFDVTSTATSPTYGGFVINRRTNTLGNGNGLAFTMFNSSNALAEYGYIGTIIEGNTAGANSGALVFAPTAGVIRTERMRITSGGSVGIGTTVPGAALDVNGNTLVGNTNNSTFVVRNNGAFSAGGGSGATFVVQYGAQNIATITNTGTGQRDAVLTLRDEGVAKVVIAANNSRGGDTYFNGGGSVGIGTTAPYSPLDVYTGASYVTIKTNDGAGSYNGFGLNFRIGNNSHDIAQIRGVYENSGGGGSGGLNILTRDSGTLTSRIWISYFGAVGIGTTSPAFRLTVGDAGKIAAYNSGNVRRGLFYTDASGTWVESDSAGNDPLLLSSPGSGGNIRFWIGGAEEARISPTGNGTLLVGTTSEYYATANRGTIEVNGTSHSILALKIGDTPYGYLYTDTTLYLANPSANSIAFQTGASPTTKMIITSPGNVGIGTTSPSYKLEVNGIISSNDKVGTADNKGFYLRGVGDVTHKLYYDTSNPANVWEYNVDIQFRYYSGGSPANRFNFGTGGTLTASGDIVAYGSPSDITLKTNIKPLENSLDKIMKLKGVSFTWKEDTDSNKMTGIKDDIGFIAQEVQEILPDLVRKNDNGLLSLRDKGITALLVEAIKELKAEINELKNK